MAKEQFNYWKAISIALFIAFLILLIEFNLKTKQKPINFGDFEIPEDDFKALFDQMPEGYPFKICLIDENKCVMIEKGKLDS